MNKEKIRAAILDQLRGAFESRLRVSRQTREQGNNSESKAEGKYDTLSIEENYLADGLAKQAHAAAEAAAEIESMSVRDFSPDDEIDLGALVKIEFSESAEWFFLAPAGGGTEVVFNGEMVTVITPESPLGLQLIGGRIGIQTVSPAAKVLRVI